MSGGARRLLPRVIFLLFLAVVSTRADVEFTVVAGFDGIVRETGWFPMRCEIRNNGPAFSGVVEITQPLVGRGDVRRVAVELPTGSLKRVSVAVFAANRLGTSWSARLVDDRGKVRAEEPFIRAQRQVAWNTVLVGSLARGPSGAPVLKKILPDRPELQPVVAALDPETLPDNPLVLESLNAIYLNSEVASALSASQADALLRWLRAGGHLVIAVEQVSDFNGARWLQNILPATPTDFRAVTDHTGLQSWLREPETRVSLGNESYRAAGMESVMILDSGSAGAPFAKSLADTNFETAPLRVAGGRLRDGKTLADSDGTPLIVAANRERGRVTMLMFSAEREPFRSWKNAGEFWAKLAGVTGDLYLTKDFAQPQGRSADGIFGVMVDTRQIHNPPIGWLMIFLILYLAVIGPLDRVVLRRIGRPMLTWVTFPCCVALFSFTIYVVGYKLRAGVTEFNELHVVDILGGGALAEWRGRTFASVYSPANKNFKFTAPSQTALMRGEFSRRTATSGRETIVTQDGDSFRAEAEVPVWSSQLFVSDWWQAHPAPLDVAARRTAAGWSVTVENETDSAVEKMCFVADGRVLALGALAAHARQTFEAATNGAPTLAEFVKKSGGTLANAARARGHVFARGGVDLEDLAGCGMASAFVTLLGAQQGGETFVAPARLDLTEDIARGRATLLAWVPNYSPTHAMGEFKATRSFRHTLFRITVQSLESGVQSPAALRHGAGLEPGSTKGE